MKFYENLTEASELLNSNWKTKIAEAKTILN